jgi:stress-induced morphogen
MRHDAVDLEIAGAIDKRRGHHRSRGERLRAAARTLAGKCHRNVEVIDEAFAGFARVDPPAAHDGNQAGENDRMMPVRLTECLSAQLHALDRQRSELVQLLRRIDQPS